MGKEDKEFEKAMQSLREGFKSISDALKERSRGRMLMRAYYEEGRDLEKAKNVCKKIMKMRGR